MQQSAQDSPCRTGDKLGVGRLGYINKKKTARVRTLLVSVPFLLLALGQRVGGVALDASIDRHHRRVDAAIEVLHRIQEQTITAKDGRSHHSTPSEVKDGVAC